MKVRSGFVSNSSSSSFVVTIKNKEDLTKDKLLDIFQVNESSPLYSFAVELSEWIIENTKKYSIKEIYENYYFSSESMTDDEMIDQMTEDYSFLDKETLIKVKDGEYQYYEGSASSEAYDSIELYLCESKLDIDTDTISIKNER